MWYTIDQYQIELNFDIWSTQPRGMTRKKEIQIDAKAAECAPDIE